jgi:hypothetical protein
VSDYSIELAAERISDARTRKYFFEVMVSYGSVAKEMLDEIESARSANDKSPEWEWKRVEEIKKRTQLLESGEFVNLEWLQK